MYLRARQYRTCISSNWLSSRYSTRPSRSAFLFDRSYQHESGDHRGTGFEHHGRKTSSKSASVRPITLFAICIPLGYALSWLVKQGEDSVDVDGFIKYKLANKQDVSSTCSIFTLTPLTTSTVRTDDAVWKRVITSVQFKQPQLQIARSYTLLPRTNAHDLGELRFLIRKERNGEVSGYLHRLPLGSELELRGLSAEYILPEKVDTAIFLAGGTGIAPAMQVADALTGEADVHILWANRMREDCAGGVSDTRTLTGPSSGIMGWSKLFSGLFPRRQDDESGRLNHEMNIVVEEVERLKQRTIAQPSSPKDRKLLVDYYVDEESTVINPQDVSRMIQQARDQEHLGKKLLFVAGPDGFVNHWAAGKVWINGQEAQGPLGGVLGSMDLREWEVVKL